MNKTYLIGIQNFESLRNDNYFYIDKTKLVYQLAKSGRYYFLSRLPVVLEKVYLSLRSKHILKARKIYSKAWLSKNWRKTG